jgi:arginine-tRNA-protein transferase
MSGEQGSNWLVTQAGGYVEDFLRREQLETGEATPCPYLPDRTALTIGFQLVGTMDGCVHRAFIDRGFRRSGLVFYRPTCGACRMCIPIRVPVATFQRTRSMRRVWRKNMDVGAVVDEPRPTDEKRELFARYLAFKHDGTMTGNRETFESFLYNAPVPAIEVSYWIGKRLAGVSLLDILPGAVSSVYMFFDPADAKRGLGTYSVLWEIEYCRTQGIAYYYLGYFVPGSKTMDYKARFRPAEILDSANQWTPLIRTEAG